jgi:hypothetical protein
VLYAIRHSYCGDLIKDITIELYPNAQFAVREGGRAVDSYGHEELIINVILKSDQISNETFTVVGESVKASIDNEIRDAFVKQNWERYISVVITVPARPGEKYEEYPGRLYYRVWDFDDEDVCLRYCTYSLQKRAFTQ